MCRPEDYEHLIPTTQEDPPIEPAPERNPILAAVDALGLPDCPPDCTCRGASPAEER